MSRIITVIGNIASGKSTLSKRLADSICATHVAADELYLTNPFFQAAVIDRARWSLASDLWFLKERVKILSKIQQAQRVVVDSGLLMGFAYAAMRESIGHFTGDEWELYQEYYHQLTSHCPVSDVVVYLSVDPGLIMERIRTRGREHEVRSYTREYVDGLHRGIEYVVTDLRQQRVPVIEKSVTTTEAVDESLFQELVLELKKYA